MRDHYNITKIGQRIAVGDLPTEKIHQLLSVPLEANGSDHPSDTIEGVRERLRLELLIRARGLRDAN